MKECRRCQAILPPEAFRADARYADGLASWCRECHRLANKEWYERNKARSAARSEQWKRANPIKAAEVYRASQRKHRLARAEKHAGWAKQNRDKRRATDAAHKAAKMKATPRWACRAAIAEIYSRAVIAQAESGVRMHVDHIVPLQHPRVCGLHVPHNLRVIPGAENEAKKNYWWPGMHRIEEAQKQGDMFRDALS